MGIQRELLSHAHPLSIVQVLEHPSPRTKFPSSQASVNRIPSPQLVVQLQGVVRLPPIQVHPVTGPLQSALHLSRPEMSPSSQISDAMFLPSPHIGEHSEGLFALQVYPASITHRLEHPSFELPLLSSHYSVPSFEPSPQTVVQVEAEDELPPEHVYPVAKPEQSDLHPMALLVSPSSQISVPTFFPSPQTGVQTEGEPVQINPVSTKQAEEHPSPLFTDPSSHDSVPAFTPSPQEVTHVDEVIEVPPVHVQPETLPEQSPLHLSKFD